MESAVETREPALTSRGNEFSFAGADSGSQVFVGFLSLGGGVLPPPLLVGFVWGVCSGCSTAVLLVLATLGLKASVTVGPGRVTVVKSWFGVPYYWRTGPVVEELWFSGDWGDPEGALGVVVSIRGKELHIGSPKSMHMLHRELTPFCAEAQGLHDTQGVA